MNCPTWVLGIKHVFFVRLNNFVQWRRYHGQSTQPLYEAMESELVKTMGSIEEFWSSCLYSMVSMKQEYRLVEGSK